MWVEGHAITFSPGQRPALAKRLQQFVAQHKEPYKALCAIFIFLYGDVGLDYRKFGAIFAACGHDHQECLRFLLRHVAAAPQDPYVYLLACLKKRVAVTPAITSSWYDAWEES